MIRWISPWPLLRLLKAVKGKTLCQEKLYAHFFDQMLAVIRRSFSDQDAAISILNNGFLRAFKKIDPYKGSGSFEGWLRRIITHAIADYYREHLSELAKVRFSLQKTNA